MCVEIVCFYFIFNMFKNDSASLVWIWSLSYDFLAFVPQFIFGYMYDNFTKIKLEYIAVLLFIVSIITGTLKFKVITLLAISIGNAILHETCAIITTSISNGKLSCSAIFVGFGSFGVVIGQTLGILKISQLWMIIPIIIIFSILFVTRKYLYKENRNFPKFNLVKENFNSNLLIVIVLIIVMSRSFIGYAVPISWKKELWQTFLLFFTMGLGKILGGILSDKFGAKKIGIFTTLACIPFLIIGDKIMILSIIGVFLFSMTMSITFGMLLDKFNKYPGLCFGITTVGLFLGVVPIFLYNFNTILNVMLIIVLSIICSISFYKTLK